MKQMLDEALQDCYAKDEIINNFINTDLCEGVDEANGDGERLEDIVLRISQADVYNPELQLFDNYALFMDDQPIEKSEK